MEQTVKKLFQADLTDKIMALIYFLVGYGFVYTFTASGFKRNLGIFTIIYVIVVLLYCWRKKISLSKESYFWMVILLTIGIPYMFWTVFPVLQVLVLIFLAGYWTLSVSGTLLLEGKTSRYVFFDIINAICLVPFMNFGAQFRVLGTKEKEEIEKKENHVLSILIGAGIAIPALLVILPLLSSADAGFEKLLSDFLNYIRDHLMATILRVLLAVPMACYLYGLIYGGIRKRNTDCIKVSSLQEAGNSVRFLPDIAIGTAMIVICIVYVLFVGLQGNYMFSAFAGTLPEEFTYAEYARRGFFELCGISAWNLVLIGCLGLFAKHERKDNKIFRVMTVCLSVLTLLIIATAMSKMVMYIIAYGLTVKRVLTMVFMLWMTIVFVEVMIQQKKEISIARVCIMIGAVMFAVLCVLPIEQWIELYNRTFVL